MPGLGVAAATLAWGAVATVLFTPDAIAMTETGTPSTIALMIAPVRHRAR